MGGVGSLVSFWTWPVLVAACARGRVCALMLVPGVGCRPEAPILDRLTLPKRPAPLPRRGQGRGWGWQPGSILDLAGTSGCLCACACVRASAGHA